MSEFFNQWNSDYFPDDGKGNKRLRPSVTIDAQTYKELVDFKTAILSNTDKKFVKISSSDNSVAITTVENEQLIQNAIKQKLEKRDTESGKVDLMRRELVNVNSKMDTLKRIVEDKSTMVKQRDEIIKILQDDKKRQAEELIKLKNEVKRLNGELSDVYGKVADDIQGVINSGSKNDVQLETVSKLPTYNKPPAPPKPRIIREGEVPEPPPNHSDSKRPRFKNPFK